MCDTMSNNSQPGATLLKCLTMFSHAVVSLHTFVLFTKILQTLCRDLGMVCTMYNLLTILFKRYLDNLYLSIYLFIG